MPVDFFVTGVQKGGTTALDLYLRAHPQIQMATVKEVHHFDDETVSWEAPDHSRLESFFDWSISGMVRGEATPIYIYWPDSLIRLHRYNAAAKLIVGLRHPTFRAFSHWRMETKRGSESLPFENAIGWEARSRVRRTPRGAHRIFSYVERSFYSTQITDLLNLFPRHQVFFYRMDFLWSNPENVLRDIQQFLNVAADTRQDRRYIVPIDTTDVGTLSPSARATLDQMFVDDIRATASLTQLDLSDWLEPYYQESIGAGDRPRLLPEAMRGVRSDRSRTGFDYLNAHGACDTLKRTPDRPLMPTRQAVDSSRISESRAA
jgi:hypothetical protein